MPLHLDIDPHGRIAAQSDEARRALADRAGRFLLLPSAADLLVARRTPAAGGAVTRPRCILAGDLAGFPIADFVAFVHQSRLSGVLTVASNGAERSLAFKDGEVRRATSSVAAERLGDVAVRLGLATDKQIAAVAQPGKPVGKALVDAGVLTANDLWKCFHEQVTAVFHAILLSRDGTFQLVDEDLADRTGTQLAVNTQSLLMDGIRRIDEMSLFVSRIPGPRAYVRPREPRRIITLKPPEQAVFALVDGRSTVAEIATRAHLSEFDTTKILYHLAEAGYVEAGAGPVRADPAERLRLVASELSEALRAVVASVPEADRPGLVAGVRSLAADPASPHAPVLARVQLGADGGLDAAAAAAVAAGLDAGAVAALDAAGDRGAVLLRALRELVFFALFLAGARLGPEEDEALSAATRARLSRAGAVA